MRKGHRRKMKCFDEIIEDGRGWIGHRGGGKGGESSERTWTCGPATEKCRCELVVKDNKT